MPKPLTPEALREALTKLDKLYTKTRTEVADELRPPAKLEDLDRLRERLGELPPLLEAWFLWHDGQEGTTPPSPADNRTLISVDECLRVMDFWSDETQCDQKTWPPTWVPLMTNGAGDYVVFDTRPEHEGKLFNFWHDSPDYWDKPQKKRKVWASLKAWAGAAATATRKDAKAAKERAAIFAAIDQDAIKARVWTKVDPPTKEELDNEPVGTAYFFRQRKKYQPHLNEQLYYKFIDEGGPCWSHEYSRPRDEALTYAIAAAPELSKSKIGEFSQFVASTLANCHDDFEGDQEIGTWRSFAEPQ